MADVLGRWYGRRPEILENSELDLAVARGAAYYSYVRSTGSGVLVRGGLPRTYFIGLGDPRDGKFSAVCLVPRGAEEGAAVEIDNPALQLVANRPVSFRLYSSLARTGDKLGDMVEFDAADPDLHMHAPLNAVIRFGRKAEERLIPVKLGARLTEIGTLETWCESKISDNRWRLQFELRKQAAGSAAGAARGGGGERAGAAVVAGVGRGGVLTTGKSPIPPEELPARLEQTMGLGKNSWPLSAIRQLADAFLSAADGRKKSPAFEARWLNLCGFCLRPGFGYPGDDFRIEQARRIYASGLTYGNQVQCEIDWWIFWGRLAGGLNRNQQTDIYQRLSGFLLPRGNKKPQRVNASLLREMWRTASSLEMLPIGTKTELGDALVEARQGGRLQRERAVVPFTAGRAQAILRPHQPGGAAGGGHALGGSTPETSVGGRSTGLPGAPHRRPHARPAAGHARKRPAHAETCPTPSGCWPFSKARKKTTRRWDEFSGKNCPRAWCWHRKKSEVETLSGRRLLRRRQLDFETASLVQPLGEFAVHQRKRNLVVGVPGGEVVQRGAIHPIGHGGVDGVVLEGDQVMGGFGRGLFLRLLLGAPVRAFGRRGR